MNHLVEYLRISFLVYHLVILECLFFHHLQLFSLRSNQIKSNQFPPDGVLLSQQAGLESAMSCIDQESLELETFLPQPPKGWGYSHITHSARLFSGLFDLNLGCRDGRALHSPLSLAVGSA